MRYAFFCVLLLCSACSTTMPASVIQPDFYTRTPWIVKGRITPITRQLQIFIDGEPVMAGDAGWCSRTTALQGRYMGAKIAAFCNMGGFFSNRNSQCELTIDGMNSGILIFE